MHTDPPKPGEPAGSLGPGRRECHHLQAHHEHGTRAAYVADRCRCRLCKEANRVAGAARTREIAYGRWVPFVDAGPARRHIAVLRATGLGIDQIVKASGIASGTIRRIVYGDPTTGRIVARIRPRTEAAILFITPAYRAPGSLVDASATHEILSALQAAGWSLPELAAELGRRPASLRASLRRAKVTAATAADVAALHRRLTRARPPARDGAPPPPRLPAEPPDAEPLPGTEGRPEPDPDGRAVDLVAVERAMCGLPAQLTEAEQVEAVRRLSAQGMSIRQIATRLGTSPRTASRRRATAVA